MKKIDFWKVTVFSIQKKIPIFKVLEGTYNDKLLFDDNEDLLYSFIKYIKSLNKNHHAQIFQDVFASFIIKDKFEKTFLEFGATNGINLSNTYCF